MSDTTGSSTAFCPKCHCPGRGIHYANCPCLDDILSVPLTEDEARDLVRNQLERAKEQP